MALTPVMETTTETATQASTIAASSSTARTCPNEPSAPYVAPKAAPRHRVSVVPPAPPADEEAHRKRQLARIATATHRTAFERRVWSLLCQVPRGRFTTYGALAAACSQGKGSSSAARAVGGALRRNPFAPDVPCHRVVASDGRLGGFKGKWPRNGEGITIQEKRALLRAEGVRFDASGTRVVGTPFVAFV